MIFANHHHLFRSIAHIGSWIEHAEGRIWWARRAIASYEPVRSHEETDREKIALHLHAPVDRPVADIELWSAHYEPQIASSIAAVEMALRRGLPIHVAVWDHNGYLQDDIIDWLNMLAQESHPLFNKLSRITWPQAVTHARRWRDHAERRHAKIAGPLGTTEILRVGKLTWYRLDTIQAIRHEGDAMHNCLASGDYDHVPDLPDRHALDGLYSLRDAKGHSRVTALLWRGDATQAYERGNRPVRPELKPYLEALKAHARSQRAGEKASQAEEEANG